jgi:hypothetical protein
MNNKLKECFENLKGQVQKIKEEREKKRENKERIISAKSDAH